ncbi:MAG: hypothetical protein M3R61_16690, partial [Chloroflexota bacterium]|nr:hypothetical protein [Chloroflexota bacterium]
IGVSLRLDKRRALWERDPMLFDACRAIHIAIRDYFILLTGTHWTFATERTERTEKGNKHFGSVSSVRSVARF